MPRIIVSQNHVNTPTLQGLESYLYDTLRPVKPRDEFVEGLKWRVVEPHKDYGSINPFQAVLFISAGIVSSLIILVTGIRAALTLIEMMKILRQSRYQAKRRSVTIIPR